MKTISIIFAVLAILLSNVMCAVVAYDWASMECGILHSGFSAPAWIAIYTSIPFIMGIIVCLVISFIFNKKARTM